MIDRIARVIRLDRAVYLDEEHGRADLVAAAQVVAVVAVAGALGAALRIAAGALPRSAHPVGAVAGSLLAPFVHWLIWSALIYAIGTTLLRGRSTYPTVLRAIGYAMAPQALAIFGVLPVVGPAVVLVGQLLSLRTGSLAVQTSLRLDLRRTIATTLLTFAAAFVISGALRAVLARIGLWAALVSP